MYFIVSIQFIHKLWTYNYNISQISSSSQSRNCNRILSSSCMVSGPNSWKMALGGMLSISRDSSEIFEMLLPKSYCKEYADINSTCQITGFQNWANFANHHSMRTFTELNSFEKFFTKYVCVVEMSTFWLFRFLAYITINSA